MFKQIMAITGIARSGTSWIAQIVDSSPDVAFRFQPLFSYAFKGVVDEDSSKEDYLHFFEGIYNSSDSFLLQTDKRTTNLYPVFNKNDSLSHLAFKENRYLYLLPKMLQYFDNFKLIGIIRHPCGSLNSWLRNPKEFPPGAEPKKEWRFGSCKNEGKVENFFGYYKWKEVANLFLDLKSKHPEKAMIINYDTFVDNPVVLTKSIFDFSDLPLSEQTTSFLKKSQAIHEESPYAVFKDKSVRDAWRSQLDPYIVNEILNDLSGTRLEMFIE